MKGVGAAADAADVAAEFDLAVGAAAVPPSPLRRHLTCPSSPSFEAASPPAATPSSAAS